MTTKTISVTQIKIGDVIVIHRDNKLTVKSLEDVKYDKDKTLVTFTDGKEMQYCKRHNVTIEVSS